MKKKLLLGLTLALSIIPSANAPTISLSRIEKMVSEMKNEYVYRNESEKVKELNNYYKQQIEREKYFLIDDFKEDRQSILMARLGLGEAEDCYPLEKAGVIYSSINRLKKHPERHGENLKEVILNPGDYSCFNENKDSFIFLKKPLSHNKKEFLSSLDITKKILTGEQSDPTNGATHYFNPDHKDLKGKYPYWAKDMRIIGRIKVGETKKGKPIWSKHIFCEEY